MNPTTPPPDKQPAAETLEQIANRICRHYLDSERVSVTQFCDIEAAILSCLRDERERCAGIADTNAEYWQSAVFSYKLNDPMRASSASRAEMAREIARVIREGI